MSLLAVPAMLGGMNPNDAAIQRLKRNSIMSIVLGTAIVWLPNVNQLAEGTALQAWMIITSVLANLGIAGLVLINVRLNLKRLRKSNQPPQEPE